MGGWVHKCRFYLWIAERGRHLQSVGSFLIFIFSEMVPGTTRPRRLLTLWLLPENQRVIGFSFQLAIIQHQFALHALGYCHLCKDDKQALRFLLCTAAGEVVLIGSAPPAHGHEASTYDGRR